MAGINIAGGRNLDDQAIAQAAQAGQVAAQGWAQVNEGFRQLKQARQFDDQMRQNQAQFEAAQELKRTQFELSYQNQLYEFDKNFSLAKKEFDLRTETLAFDKERHIEQIRQWTETENRLRATLALDTSIFTEAQRIQHVAEISGFIFDTFGNIRDAARDQYGSRMVVALLKAQGWGDEDAENFTTMAGRYMTAGDMTRKDWINGIEHPEIMLRNLETNINGRVEDGNTALAAEAFQGTGGPGAAEDSADPEDNRGAAIEGKPSYVQEPTIGDPETFSDVSMVTNSSMAGPAEEAADRARGGTIWQTMNPIKVAEYILNPASDLVNNRASTDWKNPYYAQLYAADPSALAFAASVESIPFKFRRNRGYVSHDNPQGVGARFEARRQAAETALNHFENLNEEEFKRIFPNLSYQPRAVDSYLNKEGILSYDPNSPLTSQPELHYSSIKPNTFKEPYILGAEVIRLKAPGTAEKVDILNTFKGQIEGVDPTAILRERATAQPFDYRTLQSIFSGDVDSNANEQSDPVVKSAPFESGYSIPIGKLTSTSIEEPEPNTFTQTQQSQLDAASGLSSEDAQQPSENAFQEEMTRIRGYKDEDHSNVGPRDMVGIRKRNAYTQRKAKGMRSPVITPSGTPIDTTPFFSVDGPGITRLEARAKGTGAKPKQVKAIAFHAVETEVLTRLREAIASIKVPENKPSILPPVPSDYLGKLTSTMLRSLPEEIMANADMTPGYMRAATSAVIDDMNDVFKNNTSVEQTAQRILSGYYAVGNDLTRRLTTFGLSDSEKDIVESASQFKENRLAFQASVEAQITADTLLNENKGYEFALDNLFKLLQPIISSLEFMEDPESFLSKPFFRGLFNEYQYLSSTITGIPLEADEMTYKKWALAIPQHFAVLKSSVSSSVARHQAQSAGEATRQDSLTDEGQNLTEEYKQD